MIPTTLEAATNCWTTAEQKFIDALIASTAFQDIVDATAGPGTVAEKTTAHVFREEVTKEDGTEYSLEDLETLRHYGIVTSSNEDGYATEFNTTRTHESSGEVQIVLRRIVRESEREVSPGVPMRWFKNRVGDFMGGLQEYFWDNGGPVVRSANVAFGPRETTETRIPTQGLWLTCHLSIAWGFISE